MKPGTISVRRNCRCNVLVVAPHGFPGNDENTERVAYYTAEALDCNAVINNRKYRRPAKGEREQPELHVLDLNNPDHARQCRKDYLDPILEMVRNLDHRFGKPPIVIFIHGINDGTARDRVGRHIGDSDAVFAIGAGYAADYSKNPPPISETYTVAYRTDRATASLTLISELMEQLRLELGPGGDGVPGYGATKAMPRIFRTECTFPVEAVQLELRWTGFRDSPQNMRTVGSELARVVGRLSGFEAAPAGEVGARRSWDRDLS